MVQSSELGTLRCLLTTSTLPSAGPPPGLPSNSESCARGAERVARGRFREGFRARCAVCERDRSQARAGARQLGGETAATALARARTASSKFFSLQAFTSTDRARSAGRWRSACPCLQRCVDALAQRALQRVAHTCAHASHRVAKFPSQPGPEMGIGSARRRDQGCNCAVDALRELGGSALEPSPAGARRCARRCRAQPAACRRTRRRRARPPGRLWARHPGGGAG